MASTATPLSPACNPLGLPAPTLEQFRELFIEEVERRWPEWFDSIGNQDEFSSPRTEQPKKRPGRPKGSLNQKTWEIRSAIDALEVTYEHMTVRGTFYKVESQGIVPKTEAGYRKVQRQLDQMRREGLLRWSFIVDGTRWRRKPDSYADVGDYVTEMARSYRRDLWRSQGVRLEIWLEKDALADLITDVTHEWDVSLMVSRGQSSITFLRAAAMEAKLQWEQAELATHIYCLYDHDAGGERATRTIERDLPGFAPDVPIYVHRLALDEEQIEEWGLPTRPPKKKDPDAKKWGDRPNVELDAIDPHLLTGLVEQAVTSHIDEHAWKVEQAVEAEERAGLLALLGDDA